jgi:phosphoribosylformylglycinamidine synthase
MPNVSEAVEKVRRATRRRGMMPFEPDNQPEKASGSESDQKPRVIIPTGLGINSHEELAYVFRLAGADVDYVHWNELVAKPEMMDRYQGAGLPGGFTKGDELGAGQSLANNMRQSGLRNKLAEKLGDPKFPIYSVCNCLQLLAKLDLMPVPVGTVKNDSGKHETSFWDVEVNPDCDNVWLNLLKGYEGPVFAPISHGEGRIVVSDGSLGALVEKNIIALRYARGHICRFYSLSRGDRYNPNGSTADIAGFGWSNNLALFPHFERLHHDLQRPDREIARKEKGNARGAYTPTHLMFRGAVDFMKSR